MNNFERSVDPIKSLKIGKNRPLKKGDKFRVKFLMRLSRPEYYPLQKGDRMVDAVAESDEGRGSTPFGDERKIRCFIVKLGVMGLPFLAIFNEITETWEIE
jgi:hypothetical protein